MQPFHSIQLKKNDSFCPPGMEAPLALYGRFIPKMDHLRHAHSMLCVCVCARVCVHVCACVCVVVEGSNLNSNLNISHPCVAIVMYLIAHLGSSRFDLLPRI